MEGKMFTGGMWKAGIAMFSMFCCLSADVSGQAVTFKKIIGGPRMDTGRDLEICDNGDYLIAGSSTSYTAGDSNVYVLRTDMKGNEIWRKSFGGYNQEMVYSVARTNDNNFIMTGFTSSFGAGSYDIYVIKINGSGTSLWSKTYGGTGVDIAREARPTKDGGYIVTGYSNSVSAGNYDAFLLKLDAAGNQQWMKYYGGAQYESSFSVKETPDGGYVLFGNTYSSGAGNGDFYLVKTDGSGNKQWEKVMGGPQHEEGQFVYVTGDGGYIVTGDQMSNSAGDYDVSVRKLDSGGNEQWAKLYGGTLKDVSKTVYPTADGGYIVGAITRSFGLVEPDYWIIKIDKNGAMQWDRSFGGSAHEHIYTAKQTADKGYILAGHTDTPPSQGVDVYLVKTDEMGKVTSTVGIAEASRDERMMAYPVPATDRLMVKFGKGIPAGAVVRIINPIGQVVYSKTIEREGLNEMTIDLASYARGLYFIDFINDDEKVTQKILLQ